MVTIFFEQLHIITVERMAYILSKLLLRKRRLSFLRKQESSFLGVHPCFRRGDISSFGFPQQELSNYLCSIRVVCFPWIY